MYKKIGFLEKFKFVECTKLWKFNGKLCALDIQTVEIHGKIRIPWMYDIMKVQ